MFDASQKLNDHFGSKRGEVLPSPLIGQLRPGGGDGEVAGNEGFRPVKGQADPLFAQDSDHVLDEVVTVFGADRDVCIFAVPTLSAHAERAGKELAGVEALRRDDRQTPEDRASKTGGIGEHVTAHGVLGQFDGRPIDGIEDDAIGGIWFLMAGPANGLPDARLLKLYKRHSLAKRCLQAARVRFQNRPSIGVRFAIFLF